MDHESESTVADTMLPEGRIIKKDSSSLESSGSVGWMQIEHSPSCALMLNGTIATSTKVENTEAADKTPIHAIGKRESSLSLSLPSPTTSQKPDLPLEWTTVERSRKKNNLSDDFLDDCCEDPGCRRPRKAASVDDLGNGSIGSIPEQQCVIEGHAMFCLPELDSTWFQGYFTRNDTKTTNIKPLGLLAIQNMDMDDCLQCADGGYRELSLRLCRGQRRDVKPDLILSDISWTGGDMIQWSGKHVTFDTERILTGSHAVPLVERYFRGLVQRLRESVGDDSDGDDDEPPLLELIPDVAIVLGTMKLSLPMDDADYS